MRGLLTRLLDRVAPMDETAPPSELDMRDAPSRCQTGCGRRWDTDRHGWRTCNDCTLTTGRRVL